MGSERLGSGKDARPQKTARPIASHGERDRQPPSGEQLSDLQRLMGNRAVVQLLHQHGEGGGHLVQRKLIPKVNDAFDAAIALDPAYGAKKQNTDDEATTGEQESLSRVHGRAHQSAKDSAEEKTLANLVRAVVLTEFSDRLVGLKTAKDSTTGAPISDAAKKRKREVYNKKAEEFRKKQAPLVAAGMAAPETKAFMREFGFGAAIQPDKRAEAEARAGGARVDVRSTFIGMEFLGTRLRSHLFIVYTSKEGRQMYFRGGPDKAKMTVADLGWYTPDTVDWDPSAPSVTVLEGEAAERKLDALIEATKVIDDMQVPYQAVVATKFGGRNPNALQKGLTKAAMATASEGENCNAAAWTILTRAGIPTKKPDGHHPGWGSILGSQTAGKENALPPAEKDKAKPIPYTLDKYRDATDKNRLVQVFWDRKLLEPQTKLAVGTQVTLLDDDYHKYRKISFNGQVGYVRRATLEAELMKEADWRHWMSRHLSKDDLKDVRDGDEDRLEELEDDQGIPADKSPYLAAQLLQGTLKTAENYVDRRVAQLGEDKARLLLNDPYELKNLVNLSGSSSTVVLAAITAKLTHIDEKEKVRASMFGMINDPLAADMVVNEYPSYEAVRAIAAEVGMPFPAVFQLVNECRPPDRQGNTLEQLIAGDPFIMGQLDNPDDYIVQAWSALLGLPDAWGPAFIRDRLKDLAGMKRAEAEAAKKKARTEKNAPARKKKATGAKQKTKAAQQAKPPDQQGAPDQSGPVSQALDLYEDWAGVREFVSTITTPDGFRDYGPDDKDASWNSVSLDNRLLFARPDEVAAFKRFHRL